MNSGMILKEIYSPHLFSGQALHRFNTSQQDSAIFQKWDYSYAAIPFLPGSINANMLRCIKMSSGQFFSIFVSWSVEVSISPHRWDHTHSSSPPQTSSFRVNRKTTDHPPSIA